MRLVLLISLLCLNLLNVMAHSFGTFLLIYLYKKSRHKSQQLYLINLSVSELLINLIESIRIVLALVDDGENATIERIREFLLIVEFTGASFVFYWVMIFITIDRLLLISLSNKYGKYWNERRAKQQLTTTWLLGVSMAIAVALCVNFLQFDWEEAFFKYFFPSMEFLFIPFAFFTYGFIIRKYRTKHKAVSMRVSGQSTATVPSSVVGRKRRSFKMSVFYIPVMLITTFLIFMTIPDISYLFIAIINNNPSETLSSICWISYAVSNLIDAYVYIFLQHHVRHFILGRFKEHRYGMKSIRQTSHEDRRTPKPANSKFYINSS